MSLFCLFLLTNDFKGVKGQFEAPAEKKVIPEFNTYNKLPIIMTNFELSTTTLIF